MQLPNQVADEGVEGATADAAAGQEVRSPETEGVTENDQSMSAAVLQEEKMRPPPRPLESGEEKLWQIFCDIDEDDGGTLDKEEVAKMSKKLGVTLSPDDLATAFEKMDRQRKGEVDFDCFVQWWHQVMGERRREARKKAAELFAIVDEDGGGTLDKDEVSQLSVKLVKRFKGEIDLEPPFNLEADWPLMDTRQTGEVTYKQFEEWWKKRTGDSDSSIPVLPESMTNKIAESAKNPGRWGVTSSLGSGASFVGTPKMIPGQRSGKQLWDFLRPRLSLLVDLEKKVRKSICAAAVAIGDT